MLVGDNGAGKTNLLEAVSYLATLRSFRGAPDEALIAHDQQTAVVRGTVDHAAASTLIEIELRRRTPRRVQVNRTRLARAADLIGHVRMVSFLPEDLDVVKRGPALRRDLLDEAAVQLWPGAYADRAEFERALRHRNAFLKQGMDDPVTLSVWDERFCQSAGRLMVRRARARSALSAHLGAAYEAVAGERRGAELAYGSAWASALDPSRGGVEYVEELRSGLDRARRTDRERRQTTVGPHRDDPAFLLDGHDARHHASQGEQRTLALAVRLATHRAIAEVVGAPPILLLDDVFSELDPTRAAALTGALPIAQTLITTADPAHVPLQGTRWRVTAGEVTS